MIELRYRGSEHFMKLQYRTLVPTWQASGAWGEPSAWSDWKDVEVDVDAKPPPSACAFCQAAAAAKGVDVSRMHQHFEECPNAAAA